jgi:hypothetical protein
MKKILLSTIVLTSFSLSIILFQISCKKDAVADTTTTGVNQQNKLVFIKNNSVTGWSIWVSNYDGSSPQNLNIVLPSASGIDGSLSISPDHKTIFFSVSYTAPSKEDDIYSCSIDGTNVKKLITGCYDAIPY